MGHPTPKIGTSLRPLHEPIDDWKQLEGMFCHVDNKITETILLGHTNCNLNTKETPATLSHVKTLERLYQQFDFA